MSAIVGGTNGRIDATNYDYATRAAKSTAGNNMKNNLIDPEMNFDENLDAQLKTQEQQKVGFSEIKDKENLYEELEKHNAAFAYTGKYLKFRYDEEAATSYVEVINSSTQEVIVSLPPEFLIDLAVKMKRIIGMFIDKKM